MSARYLVDGLDLARIIEAERADQSWRKQAACRGVDTALFYSEVGEMATEAKAVCQGCPVATQCADYAITAGIRSGVWGGCTDQELRALRRQRRRGAA